MQTDSSTLEKLNAYNLRVNQDMIVHINNAQPANDRIFILLSHIINAHQIWLERISGQSMSVKPFDLRPNDVLSHQNKVNYDITDQFIRERDLQEKIQYVNTKRQRFENTITEMFIHLFNHATYHRGQINQLLVQEGKEAMVSDFIVYNRTEIF